MYHAHRRLFLASALALAFMAREAHGEIYHLKTPSSVTTDGGSKLQLPPGYFLDEATWQERDLEMHRLQEQETRLGAENLSLRRSADDFPWITTGIVGVAGVVLGIVLMTVQ